MNVTNLNNAMEEILITDKLLAKSRPNMGTLSVALKV